MTESLITNPHQGIKNNHKIVHLFYLYAISAVDHAFCDRLLRSKWAKTTHDRRERRASFEPAVLTGPAKLRYLPTNKSSIINT